MHYDRLENKDSPFSSCMYRTWQQYGKRYRRYYANTASCPGG